MKKTLGTILTGVAIVGMTAGAAVAGVAMIDNSVFPYFQFGCLVVGGLLIISLKAKYDKIYMSEAVGSFAMYAILVSLFTNPVIDGIKTLLS